MSAMQVIQIVMFLTKTISELTTGANQRLREKAAQAIKEGRSFTQEELEDMEQSVRDTIEEGRADNDGENA